MDKIKNYFDEHKNVLSTLKNNSEEIENAITMLLDCFSQGNKVLLCGNGGSAADAQHIAAELVNRFKLERKGLPAIALTTDSSILTSWSNDYDYTGVFERQVEALGKKDDILIAISTSGNSENINKACKKAKEKRLKVISLLGKKGGVQKDHSDLNIIVDSDNTPRIQEMHMLIYHIICEELEKRL